ncbi:ATP-binding protein [Leptospira sp. id769339]|uniref:ATP-binding protein n=1 Tax=Leptospira sp. id769339 TaxID=2864221 RepID=UPI00214C12C4|nr:ATP-binding protein [Leptospira sp. id769339]MCR1794122.1 response regulator [Leptospira sp. id769339]
MHSSRVIFPIFIFCLLLTWNCGRIDYDLGEIREGKLDASTWDPSKTILSLSGEWELVPGKFLASEPEPGQIQESVYAPIPQIWNELTKDGKLLFPNGKGFGTYTLHLQLPENCPELMLKVPDLGTSYSIYADGKLLETVGKVGKTPETSVPFLQTSIVILPKDLKKLDFEISNFAHINGGLWFTPEIGIPSLILRKLHYSQAIDMASSAAVLVLAIYQIMAFLRTREEKSQLYFALFSLASVFRFFLTGNRLFNYVFPEIPWEISYRLEYLSTYILCSGFLSYSATAFKQDFHPKTERISLIILLIFAIPTIVLPAEYYARLLFPFQFTIIIGGAYTLLGCARAVIHARPGSRFFLVGISFIIIAGANDILASHYILNNNYILAPAIFLFIFFHSLGFSFSFSRVLRTSMEAEKGLQIANQNLNELKTELESKVESRTIQLTAAKEKAEWEAKYRYDFLAIMSHEIRTPLNGLLGTSNLLSETSLTQEQKEYADIIQASGENLLHLVNQLLDLSKIENHRFVLEILPFDPFAVLQRAARVVKARAEEKRVLVDISYPEHHPGIFLGDEGRIQQVLLNLLSNAIKFTGSGGKVCLGVRFYGEDLFSRVLEFWVEDDGVGIAEDQAAVLFEPFVQADSSVARKFGGSGLGLTISKKLVELMGGSIRITSSPGKGSKFSFLLPFPQEEPEKQDLEEEAAPPIVLPPLKILLVEDQEFSRKVAFDILTKLGMKVHSLGMGKDAIAQLERETYEIILLDIDLPDISGVEVSKKIKETFAHPPYLVAWTAHALPGSEEFFQSSGFDSYLKKPSLKRDWILFLERYVQSRPKPAG